MTDANKISSFREATTLHASEGELFGITREQVAKTLLSQAIWMHIDVHGHDATIATLQRFERITAAERDGQSEI